MSLQVWLPLNGDLHNQGLTQFNPIINTNPTWTNNGKIGQALMAGQMTMPAAATSQILNNQKFSFACWIYIAAETGSTSDRAMIFGNNPMSANNNRKFSIFQYPTCNDLHLSWQNDTANQTFVGGVWNGVFPSNQWTHLAITYNNPNGKIYINGAQYATFSGTSNSASFNYDTILFSNCPNNGRYLNDYRIYDHALSEKEVEEIAKGLVLHYKLDNNGLGNENLVTGSNTNSTSTNKWGAGSAVGGNSSTIEQDSTGIYCVKITRDNTAQSSWDYLYYNSLLCNKIKTNTKYTVSFDCKPSVNGSISFVGFVNGNATNYMTNSTTTIQGNCKADQWNHMVYQCTTINSFNDITVSGQLVYFSRSASLRGTNVTVLFKNIKVEEGTVETPWCPAITDSLYTSLNNNSNIIYDSSGYNNNGTIISSLQTTTPTSRYSCTTQFNENTDSITVLPYLSNGQTLNEITVSCWFKTNTLNSTAPNIFSLGENAFLRCRLASATSIWSYYRVVSTQKSSTYSCKNLIDDTWHLLTFTFLNGIEKVYLDGEQIGSTNQSNTGTYLTCANTAWHLAGYSANSENFIGSLSDFRIYTIALTTEQVKELYNTSATIDNSGNIYARELVE